jgi:integrase
MRIGEICTLKVRDFNPAERCVVLHDTKNGDRRMVPLSKKALAAFHVLTADRKPGLKIVPLLADSLGLYFRQAREAAGLANSDLRFHDARHEATTRLSRKLTNVLELSAVTGHRDLHSLKRYYNPTAMELAAKLD